MSSPEAISAQLVEIVRRSPHQKILGSNLAVQLRRNTQFNPDLHGKLGVFIARHTAGVRKLERHGGDWYYGLAGSPEQGARSETEIKPLPESKQRDLWALERLGSGPVWKTYVSPGTHYRLMGNQQTGALATIPPGKPVPESPWVAIPPCSRDQHAEIAKAFVGQLEEPIKRVALQELIERAGSGPSSGFFEKVRELGLGHTWARFRRDRILENLAVSLESAGIDFSGTVDLYTSDLPGSQRTPLGGLLETAPVVSQATDIHKIATAAIGRMSEAELRNLPIPLGYILDIIGSR